MNFVATGRNMQYASLAQGGWTLPSPDHVKDNESPFSQK